jgi:hypothetical protein
MKRHFIASGAIHAKDWRPREARVLLKQAQWLSILPKSGAEAGVLFSCKTDYAQLRDHDRPTKDRSDGEKREDEFSCDRRVIEREKETAGR